MPYELTLNCEDNAELPFIIGPVLMTDENGDLITPQTSEIINVEMDDGPPITVQEDGNYEGFSWDYVWAPPAAEEGNELSTGAAAYVYNDQSILRLDEDFDGTIRFLVRSGSSAQNGDPNHNIKLKDSGKNVLGTLDNFVDYSSGAAWVSFTGTALRGGNQRC